MSNKDFFSNEKDNELIKQLFENDLKRNGFGFQYAVIKKIKDLRNYGRSAFLSPEVAEVPVQVGSSNTHIDFILFRPPNNYNDDIPLYVVAECKRANPALSDWCFIRSSFTKSDGMSNSLILDNLKLVNPPDDFCPSYEVVPQYHENFFQIGREIKSDQKGESKSAGRGALEDATSQVLKGVNGFIELLLNKKRLMVGAKIIYFVPVIFTTANLWSSDANIGEADLATGNLSLDGSNFKSQQWLFYEYNQSQALKHSRQTMGLESNLSQAIDKDFTRTIAIVNANGIEDFVNWASTTKLPS